MHEEDPVVVMKDTPAGGAAGIVYIQDLSLYRISGTAYAQNIQIIKISKNYQRYEKFMKNIQK